MPGFVNGESCNMIIQRMNQISDKSFNVSSMQGAMQHGAHAYDSCYNFEGFGANLNFGSQLSVFIAQIP